jgi:hypothetical protein
LERPRLVFSGFERRQGQGHVDSGGDTGGGDDPAVDQDTFGDRLCAEASKLVNVTCTTLAGPNSEAL